VFLVLLNGGTISFYSIEDGKLIQNILFLVNDFEKTLCAPVNLWGYCFFQLFGSFITISTILIFFLLDLFFMKERLSQTTGKCVNCSIIVDWIAGYIGRSS
jgi:hypothetical protein